jgi:hypothetical protein
MEENITIEFVRNWIVKHRLTRKSYESVLTDTLTNNGHYYIDNPYLRDWIRENTEMFRKILPYELNENQQVVLEWLKWSVEEQGVSPMDAVYLLVLGESLDSVSLAYIALTPDQQTQVLAAFAEWGMKEVAE